MVRIVLRRCEKIKMHKVCPKGFRVVGAQGLFSQIGGIVPVCRMLVKLLLKG